MIFPSWFGYKNFRPVSPVPRKASAPCAKRIPQQEKQENMTDGVLSGWRGFLLFFSNWGG
jgi:hypothetical protein